MRLFEWLFGNTLGLEVFLKGLIVALRWQVATEQCLTIHFFDEVASTSALH